jgi:ComF family protein
MPVCAACLRKLEPLAADYFCVSCRTPFQNEFPLDEHGQCALCRSGLRGFDAAYCFGAYEGPLRELVHLFKYAGMKPLSGPFARLMSAAVPLDQAFDLVVPVPLHWRRKWKRGFNQSHLLARALAAKYGIRLAQPLRRGKPTPSQAGLTNAMRRTNVAGAFDMKRGQSVEGYRVLLVDDVMTTGATGSACAFVLKRAGAKYVALLTLARVDRRMAAPETAERLAEVS